MAMSSRLRGDRPVRLRAAPPCVRLRGVSVGLYMMRELSRLLGASALVGLSALGIAACEDAPIGPSLGAVPVTNLGLTPSQGNVGLCCCHVTGAARNDNSVAVHVTIKFSAFNVARPANGPDPEPLSTIL